MIILVDQDDVLTEFRATIEKKLKERGDIKIVPLDKLTTFAYEDNYPENVRNAIKRIFYTPGFHMNLPIMPGAKKALEKMVKLGTKLEYVLAPYLFTKIAYWKNTHGWKKI